MPAELKYLARLAFTVALVAAALAYAYPSAAAERLTVHIYKYNLPPADDVAEQYLNQFFKIVEAKVVLLGAELGDESEAYKDLSLFQVKSGGEWQESSGTSGQLDSRWQTSNALQIFLGRVTKIGDEYAVRTRVYFGELPARMSDPFLNLDMFIRGDEFDSTRDSHSAVILYALALDACLQSKPPDQVIGMLSKAKESLSDVPDELMGVTELRAAIEAELAAGGSCSGEQT